MIQVSDIAQYFYCPRKVYFLRTLGIHPPEKPKMKMGKEEHEKEYQRVRERRDIFGFSADQVERLIHRLPAESSSLRLYGVVDAIVVLRTGEYLPVEVKFSNYYNVLRNRKKQLIAYALLLDEKFDTNVCRGIVYFSTARLSRIIEITCEDKIALKRDIENIRNLIQSEKMPEEKKGRRCNYCEMDKFCS